MSSVILICENPFPTSQRLVEELKKHNIEAEPVDHANIVEVEPALQSRLSLPHAVAIKVTERPESLGYVGVGVNRDRHAFHRMLACALMTANMSSERTPPPDVTKLVLESEKIKLFEPMIIPDLSVERPSWIRVPKIAPKHGTALARSVNPAQTRPGRGRG